MIHRLLIVCCCLTAGSGARAAAAGPEDVAVGVLATQRYPNPVRPWTNGSAAESAGTGIVIEGKRILTAAHVVLYATEVYVQPRPGERKYEANVEAIAPDMDLAILTIDDDEFFEKRPPLPRPKELPEVQDAVTVYGFPIGGNGLSVTDGVISRIGFDGYYQQGAGLTIQISAPVNPGNSGGPAVVDGKLVGMVFSRLGEGENIGYVIPNEEIDLFLEDVADGRYDGKPVDGTGTQYQTLDNEALRNFLKLDGKVGGVLIDPPPQTSADYPFRDLDVLVKIGEHEIDREGMVRLPDGLRLPFFSLIPRLARDGAVPVSLIRDGEPVAASLPVGTEDNRLIREFRGEKPSYFIHGPFVFTSAKADAISLYTQHNPLMYVNKSPLIVRRYDRVAFPGEELVMVAGPMFPHRISRGYSDSIGQVLKEVNDVPVRNLHHLVELLRDSEDEYLRFEFAEVGSELMVFDREEMNDATAEILEENGISPSRRGSEDMLAVWKEAAAATTP